MSTTLFAAGSLPSDQEVQRLSSPNRVPACDQPRVACGATKSTAEVSEPAGAMPKSALRPLQSARRVKP
jgi:hypothetical protein